MQSYRLARRPIWALSLVAVIGLVGSPSRAQEEKPEVCVEELTAILQSIEPYQPQHQASGAVVVFGSTSMDAMAHSWTTGFKRFHPQVKVEIFGSNPEAALARLVKEPSGIAMLSRPVKEQELEELKRQGLKSPAAFEVAREALGVFVHADNPISTVSGAQLREIFTTSDSAETPQWSRLGATDVLAEKPIHVISRTPNSGTQRFLEEFVFRASDLREGVSEYRSNAEVLQEVAKDPLAIAICGLRSNQRGVKSLQLVAGASVVPSDDHAVLCGQYPLTRPFTMILDVARQDAQALASQEFVRYGLCQAGQADAIMTGLFPIDLPLLRAGLQKLETPALR